MQSTSSLSSLKPRRRTHRGISYRTLPASYHSWGSWLDPPVVFPVLSSLPGLPHRWVCPVLTLTSQLNMDVFQPPQPTFSSKLLEKHVP
ncbi:hypothetical protein CGRA01v4_06409 [Colletotrichum graminicola]|nr:hypothetical protein CGRA01v4_06409 [Colletotrichum graminicola]